MINAGRDVEKLTQEKDILERLELKVRPITKELRFYFDGHTTLSKDSDFIVTKFYNQTIFLLIFLF